MDEWEIRSRRARIDAQLDKLKVSVPYIQLIQHKSGWIRYMRHALGMSAEQLAKRAGIGQPRISRLEKAELIGDLNISSLKKLAEAMNMDFIYAFVPRQSLEEMVQHQARLIALERMTRLHHTMHLEQQGLSTQERDAMLDEMTQKNPRTRFKIHLGLIMFNTHDPDTTLLSPDDYHGLKSMTITTRAELNAAEQRNINDALAWLQRRRRKTDVLNEKLVFRLHEKMFGQVWKWAGNIRRSNTNIGVNWPTIASELRALLDDTFYQIAHTTYAPDEIAYRFHHRLVFIHVFPNGNGRHAREMTDVLLLDVLQQPRFSWGSAHLTAVNEDRTRYIQALKAADRHDYTLLAQFVRS